MYTSFISGPRRAGDLDGPEEFYLVLLDNGRTKLLADAAKRESLFCIRCGALPEHLSGVSQDRRAQLSVDLLGAHRCDYFAAVPGHHARPVAAVRVQPVRRLR